jgi:acetoacetyl-CoA synthetase
MTAPAPGPIWTPSPERVRDANLNHFLAQLRVRRPDRSEQVWDVPSLYRWSVEHPEAFWPEVWRAGEVVADERPGRDPWDEVVAGLDRMGPPDPVRGPRWFPGARLNFAENLLRHDDERDALVFWNEAGRQRRISHRQ